MRRMLRCATWLLLLGSLPTPARGVGTCPDTETPLWTMSEVQSYSKATACLVVLYNTVYDLKEFADIHRGGPWSITRNCGTDATFGYESLACIPGVPDHTRGVLNMVEPYNMGVIQNSDADPCSSSYPPQFDAPDFASCDVYNVVTCDDLPIMPNGGKWDETAVSDPSKGNCIVTLYDYVFDVGSPPQTNNWFTPPGSGTLTFAQKHGGGPTAVLNNCRKDLTPIFETLRDIPGVPDHTMGALNAILPYLVGVVEDSDADPCPPNEPPLPDCDNGELTYWSLSEVQAQASGCFVVVLGKVYDLVGFAQYHYGGSDEILERCRQDITGDFLEKSFHTLAQLGAIRQFQRGVIENGMADPCGLNYDPNPDPAFGDSGDSEDSEEDSEEDSDENSGIPLERRCFSGESSVQVRGRGIVAVKNLKIGDYVLVDTNNHYEPVYGFGHKEIETQHSYLQIGTASGAQLEISKEHMLFVEKHGAIPSSLVRLGDKVYLNNDLDQVKSIQIVSREGAYAPFTPSGTIIVNGIKASSFVALQNSPDLAIGRFSTGISHQWIARTFELPHRIWCTLITSCESEEYNPQGISTWVAVPLKIAIWYIQQDTLTMAVLSIPLLIWLCVLGLLDLVMVYAAWFASLVAAVVVWQALSRFFQERSNSKNHAVLSKLLPSSLRA